MTLSTSRGTASETVGPDAPPPGKVGDSFLVSYAVALEDRVLKQPLCKVSMIYEQASFAVRSEKK
jgi:hypothetical protein